MTSFACSIDGCTSKVVARGWCNAHYLRWRHHGDPLGGKPGPAVRKVIDFPDCTRKCTGCGGRKLLSQFDKDSSASLGRRSKCKACRSVQMKNLYARDPDRFREYERCRRRDEAPHMRKIDTERYLRNREKRIALAKESVHRRRVRVSNAKSDRGISRQALRGRYGDLCCYCGVAMHFRSPHGGEYDPRLATIEHVIPISKGGTHVWDNVRLACWQCNVRRNNMPLDQWLLKLSEVPIVEGTPLREGRA